MPLRFVIAWLLQSASVVGTHVTGFALGILLFGESPSPLRLLAVGLIVAGIVILKLATRQG